jgi:hypothetical protein
MNNMPFVLLVEMYRFGMYVGFFLLHLTFLLNYLDKNCQVSSICYKIIHLPCIFFIVCSYKSVSGKSATLK